MARADSPSRKHCGPTGRAKRAARRLWGAKAIPISIEVPLLKKIHSIQLSQINPFPNCPLPSTNCVRILKTTRSHHAKPEQHLSIVILALLLHRLLLNRAGLVLDSLFLFSSLLRSRLLGRSSLARSALSRITRLALSHAQSNIVGSFRILSVFVQLLAERLGGWLVVGS